MLHVGQYTVVMCITICMVMYQSVGFYRAMDDNVWLCN